LSSVHKDRKGRGDEDGEACEGEDTKIEKGEEMVKKHVKGRAQRSKRERR